MRSIALVMMVLNEEATLATTIRSAVEALGDELGAVVIVDTGSTDGTRDVLEKCQRRDWFPRDVLTHLSVFEPVQPFRFDDGRNMSLRSAEDWLTYFRGVGDRVQWLFMLDAGTVVRAPANGPAALALGVEVGAGSNASALRVTCRLGTLQYQRPQIFRRGAGWKYTGARHECATGPGEVADSGLVVSYELKDPARPARWESDLEALRPDAEAGEPRAQFYYAQTFHCLKRNDAAWNWYEIRYGNTAGFWQERYVSALRCAELDPHVDTALIWTRRAIDLDPLRAEAFIQQCYTRRKDARPAWLANEADARHALTLTPPADALFTDLASYGWKAHDELALALYHLGRFEEAADHWTLAIDDLEWDGGADYERIKDLRLHANRAVALAPAPAEDRARMANNREAAIAGRVRGRE